MAINTAWRRIPKNTSTAPLQTWKREIWTSCLLYGRPVHVPPWMIHAYVHTCKPPYFGDVFLFTCMARHGSMTHARAPRVTSILRVTAKPTSLALHSYSALDSGLWFRAGHCKIPSRLGKRTLQKGCCGKGFFQRQSIGGLACRWHMRAIRWENTLYQTIIFMVSWR